VTLIILLQNTAVATSSQKPAVAVAVGIFRRNS
jgi:hypothetical protein